MKEQIAFWSLAALTLIPAAFVVTSRNLLHAGYWLFPCLVGVAGLFAVLHAHFLFVAQLLVYAGAILVLILFAMMLTRDVMNPKEPQTNKMDIIVGPLCAVGGLACSYGLARYPWGFVEGMPAPAAEQTVALGKALIATYALPFEVASLLLLAALVGSIVLAKSEREPEPPEPPLEISEAIVAEIEQREVVEAVT
jgi:NADH-quinone oxidoreductase subunit J